MHRMSNDATTSVKYVKPDHTLHAAQSYGKILGLLISGDFSSLHEDLC